MNLLKLQTKLVAAARAQPRDERVPYAFEKRVMALLPSRAVADQVALWARALWRAAASCVVIALLLGVWVCFRPNTGSGTLDLSQTFENTLLASVDQSAPPP